MRIRFLAASIATLVAHSTATAAPPPPPMTPSAPWNVEFADSMCLLSRPYGKDGAISLFLKPNMLGNGMEIIVARATSLIGGPGHGEAAVAIGGQKLNFDTYYNAQSTAKARLLRIMIPEDKIELSALRDTLLIDAGSRGLHLFSLAGIERAFPVLASCVAQLRAVHKVSDADIGAIATKPKGSAADLFTPDDFPSEALGKGQSGTVGVLFWVEANGRVSTCQVIESSASTVLEQATCNIVKRRGRFTAATDAAGKAVRAPSFTRISWMLPDG